MPVKIRLKKPGRLSKKRNNFRIVVCDERKGRDGSFIEEIGFYNPSSKQEVFKINEEKYNYWISKGAQPTDTIRSLVKKNK